MTYNPLVNLPMSVERHCGEPHRVCQNLGTGAVARLRSPWVIGCCQGFPVEPAAFCRDCLARDGAQRLMHCAMLRLEASLKLLRSTQGRKSIRQKKTSKYPWCSFITAGHFEAWRFVKWCRRLNASVGLWKLQKRTFRNVDRSWSSLNARRRSVSSTDA